MEVPYKSDLLQRYAKVDDRINFVWAQTLKGGSEYKLAICITPGDPEVEKVADDLAEVGSFFLGHNVPVIGKS